MKDRLPGTGWDLHRGRPARGDRAGAEFERLRTPTIHEAILAVERGEADRALVPFENSIEGSVRSTLDTLAFDAEKVTIVGEHDFAVRAMLLAREPRRAGARSTAVLSTPAARPVRPLPARGACRRPSGAASAAPPRRFASSASPRRPGRRSAPTRRPSSTAARSCVRGSRTRPTTSPASSGSPRRGPSRPAARDWKTSLVFSELGEDHPGALVDALREFSSREVNLSRIESRPLRLGLGRYMFFCDLEGARDGRPVSEAIEALRTKADSVRILGSYPSGYPCVEFPAPWHEYSYSTQRMSRSTSAR